MWVPSLGQEDPLEEGMVTHSSILAWRIPWTEECGRLQSMGSQRFGHDLATEQQQRKCNSRTLYALLSYGVNICEACGLGTL